MTEKIQTSPNNAAQFADWIKNRGGILQWDSADLSDPDWSVFTPARPVIPNENPTQLDKPHWKAADNPRLIQSTDDVLIVSEKEVKRFHVAVRRGSQGLSVKLTDASSAKVRKAVEAFDGAWYAFDYEAQEAVIHVPGESASLTEWLNRG